MALPNMPWRIRRARLLEMLAQSEGHIIGCEQTIARQQQIIQELEADGCADSTTAETARAILASMERARRAYIAEHEQIRRMLVEFNDDDGGS